MKEYVGIRINETGPVLPFDPGNLKLKENVTVLVENEKGIDFGKVEKIPMHLSDSSIPIRKIIRISNKKDYTQYKKNKRDAKKAILDTKKICEKLNLNMQVLDANYNFERTQLQIRFLADTRVDFRELAKELAAIYKTRIELRQIGIRDKAKEVGGFGVCGRCLCCSRFLKDFNSVTIAMAKNQNISLNPTKINGVCGRLLCCLKYENEDYKKCRECLPKVGSIVETKQGKGKVISVDLLKQKYTVEFEDHSLMEIEKDCDETNP